MRSTFVSHVRRQTEAYGDTRHYTFLREQQRGLAEEAVSYRELDRDARAMAVWLAQRPEAGQPVLLLYPPGLEFLRAFLGCLYAGVIAVPAPIPHDARSMARVAGILADTGAELVLTVGAFAEPLTAWVREAGVPVSITATDTAGLADADAWAMPEIDSDTVAFLQYTSGSTSEPKGVVVTHGNLLHNADVTSAVLDLTDADTGVGWLPHFHDMGLIGMLLQPLYSGGSLVFMSPLTFLKRPTILLDAIHRYRAAVTVAPNFAYELIARRVRAEQLTALDLSSLRVALAGAEPIRPQTLETVIERLGPAGFAAETFVAAYGLAEVTLVASASRAGHPLTTVTFDRASLEDRRLVPADAGIRLVGNGKPGPGIEIRIVDPRSGQALPDGHVGEIWIAGASVAQGYWNRPMDTAEKFGARLAARGPYLRTGDLGAIHAGEIFVTGRIKDLIIVNGRNLYPSDIEDAVRALHPALADAIGAVVGVDTGRQERLVLIQGVRTAALGDCTTAELAARIRTAIAEAFELPAPNVVLVEHRSVHRTTSGKVQRNSMRSAFLDNTLDAVLHEEIEPSVRRLRAAANA
ncbi:fatty acyl-AMP ligase [Nocardia yamanashiensis]|uniref:fatty acyl-AMP ligase n=1 Tax=Nocardia yamanashiensis TaxID=209247 RepID=UPI001E4D2FB8|nr:fatty acyl-AMP ligase [Nocardia yamanashiensis]UGT44215.1 fatty acyl-AMP ligase [Nocardia yamanashiensis]